MSPKIKNYSTKDKTRIRPQISLGPGTGYLSEKEQEILEEQQAMTFNLVNITETAKKAKQGDNVIPFTDNHTTYIHHKAGVIGEAPPKESKKIIEQLNKGIRFTGTITSIKHDKKLLVTITLTTGK